MSDYELPDDVLDAIDKVIKEHVPFIPKYSFTVREYMARAETLDRPVSITSARTTLNGLERDGLLGSVITKNNNEKRYYFIDLEGKPIAPVKTEL